MVHHTSRTEEEARAAVAGPRFAREPRRGDNHAAPQVGVDRLLGESRAMQQVRATLRKIAESPTSTVLLTGESGTGKDFAAEAIHYDSARAAGPFIKITCSAITGALLESELFGHERGAFTDASSQKLALLEIGDGGSVFLDEIAEMSPLLQAKLLRFLEEKAFRPLAGST